MPLQRVGKKLKLDGKVAKLKLYCAARDAACRGTVSLRTKSSRLGSARFRIGVGKVGTVKVKIGRKVRRRLAALPRKRLARVKVVATARIGEATTKFTFGASR